MTIHKQDDSVETPIDSYSHGPNWWLQSIVKLCPTPPIEEDALINASTIIEVSVFLVIHGFYKSAVSELRRALDDFLTRNYFDELEKQNLSKNKEYIEWSLGKTDKYPRFKNVLETIFSSELIKKYDSKFYLKEDIERTYFEMSKYTHNRPDKSWKKELSTASSLMNTRFVGEEFDKWCEYLKQEYVIISTVLLLRYPELTEIQPQELGNFRICAPEIVKQIEATIGHKV